MHEEASSTLYSYFLVFISHMTFITTFAMQWYGPGRPSRPNKEKQKELWETALIYCKEEFFQIVYILFLDSTRQLTMI